MKKLIFIFAIIISNNVFSQDISYKQLRQTADNNNLNFPRGNAVGYQPVITTIPSGAFLSATSVISADRRYVRISLSPIFRDIRHVQTFNFISGVTN